MVKDVLRNASVMRTREVPWSAMSSTFVSPSVAQCSLLMHSHGSSHILGLHLTVCHVCCASCHPDVMFLVPHSKTHDDAKNTRILSSVAKVAALDMSFWRGGRRKVVRGNTGPFVVCHPRLLGGAGLRDVSRRAPFGSWADGTPADARRGGVGVALLPLMEGGFARAHFVT